jgi:hypothetical protein
LKLVQMPEMGAALDLNDVQDDIADDVGVL